jgi:hypothetical protein
LVQDVLIHIALKDKDKAVEYPKSFTVMPFFGKFEIHDGLVRPER